jgi:trimeric autotransporter adhesin
VAAGTTVPVMQIDTIGDIVAACVNSAGGTAGDNTACGNLFSLTTEVNNGTSSVTPTDTVTALLHLANNPAFNSTALYALAAPNGPFQPALTQAPTDFAVHLAAPSAFTVSPAVLSFPATRVGSTSAPQTITFTNNTATAIGIDLPLTSPIHPLSGTNPGDFPNAGFTLYSCPTPILPGATCTIEFSFAPAATGARSAYLAVNNTSANPAIGIALTGQGLEASAGPASLSQASLNITTAGTPTNVTLTNSGSSPLTIDGISISNDPTSGQPAFTQTNTCGTSLAANSTCTISITATATAQAYSTGVLTVGDDAAGGPQTLSLSYSNGFSGPVLFDFGSRSVGTQGAGAINNVSGYVPGSANSITFSTSGPDAADFTIPPPNNVCNPTRTNPLCGFSIDFTPSAQGLRTATVTKNGSPIGGVIGTGLPAGVQFTTLSYPQIVSTGLAPPLSTVNFNAVLTGQTSTVTVEILNTGTVPFTLNTPVLGGPNAPDFGAMLQCTSSIAPNGTCLVSLTAAPSQSTNRSAAVTFMDSTGAAQRTLSLQALGLNPAPVASPASLTFPYTPLGSVSAAQSFTVTSYNNDPVSIVVGDAPFIPFVLNGPSTCAQTPCTVYVSFAPTQLNTSYDPNNSNAYGDIYVRDLNSGQSGLMTAIGTLRSSISVSPATLSFPPQTVGTTSSAQSILLTNTGNQTLSLTIGLGALKDYVLSNGCGATLAAGANCSVGVQFKPSVTGTRNNSVEIDSQAPSSPDSVQLTGTGQ